MPALMLLRCFAACCRAARHDTLLLPLRAIYADTMMPASLPYMLIADDIDYASGYAIFAYA